METTVERDAATWDTGFDWVKETGPDGVVREVFVDQAGEEVEKHN